MHKWPCANIAGEEYTLPKLRPVLMFDGRTNGD